MGSETSCKSQLGSEDAEGCWYTLQAAAAWSCWLLGMAGADGCRRWDCGSSQQLTMTTKSLQGDQVGPRRDWAGSCGGECCCCWIANHCCCWLAAGCNPLVRRMTRRAQAGAACCAGRHHRRSRRAAHRHWAARPAAAAFGVGTWRAKGSRTKFVCHSHSQLHTSAGGVHACMHACPSQFLERAGGGAASNRRGELAMGGVEHRVGLSRWRRQCKFGQ